MMERLKAFLAGKVAAVKATNRENRIKSALNASKVNFEEQRDDAALEIERLTESLATCEKVEPVLQAISEQMDIRDEAIRGIKRVEEMSNYFKEEIEVQ
jgi:hypothetical protein|nr:MAG TPA: hypothetical protein [Caudoviricetes sp.]